MEGAFLLLIQGRYEADLDEELISRVNRGERGAFDLLYERYFPRVCGYVRKRIGNPADVDETVQEVFVNVFTSLESYRAEAPFAAWVLGVARRTVAKYRETMRIAPSNERKRHPVR